MKSPLSCAQCEQMLSLSNPEELSDINHSAVNNHITVCAKCAFVLKKNRETDALLRSLPTIEPLPELPYELQRLWRTEDSSPPSDNILAENVYSLQELNGGLRRKSRPSTKRLAAALAMIAIFLATLFASTTSSVIESSAQVPFIESPAQMPSAQASQGTSEMPLYFGTTSTFLMSYNLLNTSGQDFWGFGSGACTLNKAGYHVGVSLYVQTKGGTNVCFTSQTYSSDLAIEVVMEISQGDSAGIAFLEDKAAGVPSYYSFTISSDGTYQLARHATQNIIVSEGQSSAIKAGLHQTNKIATRTQGDQIYLYANSQLLYKGIGSTSRQEAVGFSAMSDDSTLTEVSFTRAIVWT